MTEAERQREWIAVIDKLVLRLQEAGVPNGTLLKVVEELQADERKEMDRLVSDTLSHEAAHERYRMISSALDHTSAME